MRCGKVTLKAELFCTPVLNQISEKVLAEVREQLYCFPRQNGKQQANALKTICPNLGKTVRSFTVLSKRCDPGPRHSFDRLLAR